MIEKDFAENNVRINGEQEGEVQKKETKEDKKEDKKEEQDEKQKEKKEEQKTFEKLCALQKLIKNEAFLRDIGKYYYFNYK